MPLLASRFSPLPLPLPLPFAPFRDTNLLNAAPKRFNQLTNHVQKKEGGCEV